jgi:lysophospholipase L1-like esterase
VRILPLGDSLTLGYGSAVDGAGTEPGYRLRLLTRLREAGHAIDMVGSQSNGPAALDDRDHEGHNGFAVPQIAELADDAIDDFQPDIVLLMAGTNDQIELFPPSQPPADAAADMEALVARLHDRRAGMQIILAQLIPLNLNDAGVVAYNALLPGIVDRQRARGVSIELVDMYQIGQGALSSDGIHPTQAGYDAMADIWYQAVSSALADRSGD